MTVLRSLPAELLKKLHVIVVGKDKFQAPKDLPVFSMPVIEQVEKYFWMLDLFVLPARIEEFGLVASEAMACGTPVLLSPSVGAAELWENPEDITCALDPGMWCEKVTSLMKDAVKREELSRLGPVRAAKASQSEISQSYQRIFGR